MAENGAVENGKYLEKNKTQLDWQSGLEED